jgi:hypothetical protein
MRVNRIVVVVPALLMAGCGTVTSATVPLAAASPSCSLGATLPGADAALKDSFPPAAPPPAGLAPLSKDAAIAAARRYQFANPPDLNAPTVSVEEGYAQAVIDAGGGASADPRIAPDRCTWVVTVTAPIAAPVGRPNGGMLPIHPRYTLLIDVATGRMEELDSPPA